MAEVIDNKLEKEEWEQTEFFTILKEEFENDERNQEKGFYLLEKIIGRKLIKPYSSGFSAIMKDEKKVSRAFFLKNITSNLLHMLEHKMKRNQ